MKNIFIAILSLTIGLGIGYAIHEPKTVEKTKVVVKRDAPIISLDQKTYTQKLPAFHTALLNLDQASVVFKTGKEYRISYQTTSNQPKKFFCEKGYFTYDDEVDHYAITKIVIEAPKKSLKWIETTGACTLDGVDVEQADLKGIDYVLTIKDSYVRHATFDGATLINSHVNGKYYKHRYHEVPSVED